ncbi:MAG: hypothetical protein A4E55_02385 [Pelotomaculum sp. PtaU1.Bin035]|nr:MAG: hypothetical protein A4E55_02385 [Pelotomaculum sp. PtaU1.Bin035]
MLKVYVFSLGGPAYFGLFKVDGTTIRELSTNRSWGQVKKEYRMRHGHNPGEIVRVVPLDDKDKERGDQLEEER